MVSYEGTSFGGGHGLSGRRPRPAGRVGVAAPNGKILRVADTGFEPGDDFCTVWHFFDLIAEGADGRRLAAPARLPAGWQDFSAR
jgi:hypothetical protein